jgi:hypothetical protein
MTPLHQELSRLEVEPLQIVSREGFDTPPGFHTPPQDSRLETLTTLDDVEVASLLNGKGVFPANSTKATCCCCCCPICCC